MYICTCLYTYIHRLTYIHTQMQMCTNIHVFMTRFLRVFPPIYINLFFTRTRTKSVAGCVFILHPHTEYAAILCHAQVVHNYAYMCIRHAHIHTYIATLNDSCLYTHTHTHSCLFPSIYCMQDETLQVQSAES